MKKWIVQWIQIYQSFISIVLPRTCRFYPSCSQYAKESFQKYPFIQALYLAVKRLLKCHPYHSGGYDPLR